MKRVIKIAGIFVALLLVIAIAVPFFFNADQFRPLLESKLTEALGRQVTLGGLKLSLLSGSVSAADLAIADDPAFSKSAFLHASSLQVGVEMWPLISSRKLNVTGITIAQPQISLVENGAGAWNFSSLGGKASDPPPAKAAASLAETPATPDLAVKLIKISNGRITFTKTAGGKPLVLDKLDIEVRDFAAGSPFTLSLKGAFSGGGTIQLDGKAGPFDAGDAIATPVAAELHVAHLDLALSGAFDPALGYAGIASIDGKATSGNATLEITGKLKGEQLKLVKTGSPAKNPLEVDFAVVHNLRKQTGTLQKGDIHLGKAVASVTGTYNDAGTVPQVNLKLVGKQLDAAELGTFLPALDVRLPAGASIDKGTADVDLAAEGPAGRLVSKGTLGLDNVRLANYDLASKLEVINQLAGIKAEPHTEIQKFRANVTDAPAGTQVEDLDLVVPSIGEMTGAGTVSPTHQLDFKMRANVQKVVQQIAGRQLNLDPQGIPFSVTGTSESPVFKPDIKNLTKDVAKQKLTDFVTGFLGGDKNKKQQ